MLRLSKIPSLSAVVWMFVVVAAMTQPVVLGQDDDPVPVPTGTPTAETESTTLPTPVARSSSAAENIAKAPETTMPTYVGGPIASPSGSWATVPAPNEPVVDNNTTTDSRSAAPTTPPLPPTGKPVAFQIPIPSSKDETANSTAGPDDGDDDDDDDDETEIENRENNDSDDAFMCPICGGDATLMIGNRDAIVTVPVLGPKTCEEWEDLANIGTIEDDSECALLQLLVPSVCDCTPRPVAPTYKPVPAPTKTIPTCAAMKDARIENIDITINLQFDNPMDARYVGWYIMDYPQRTCVQIGAAPDGNFYGRTKQDIVRALKENSHYVFMVQLQPETKKWHGSFNITSTIRTDDSNGGSDDVYLLASEEGTFRNGDKTTFVTPIV